MASSVSTRRFTFIDKGSGEISGTELVEWDTVIPADQLGKLELVCVLIDWTAGGATDFTLTIDANNTINDTWGVIRGADKLHIFSLETETSDFAVVPGSAGYGGPIVAVRGLRFQLAFTGSPATSAVRLEAQFNNPFGG